MDFPAPNSYLHRMIARLVSLLAIFALATLTTVASAHAARMSMSVAADHATHSGAMIHSSDQTGLACDAERDCGSADAGMCGFVCAGLAAFLTPPGVDAGHVYAAASHGVPAEAIHLGRTPGLTEHPPKRRLL